MKKILPLLPFYLLLLSCKEDKLPTVTVYDEVSSFAEAETKTITGAKLVLLKDIEPYSTVKVVSIKQGNTSELSSFSLAEKDDNEKAISLRFHPNWGNKNTWSVRYRSPSSSTPIYSEELKTGFRASYANRSRYGRLREKKEVLDAFMILPENTFYDAQQIDKYFICRGIESFKEFSKTLPEAKFILLTLE
ncbi:hypothetical protein SAMN02745181_3407 [Rubritalea squalenifaciens DSM 18772]|uniref:Lipoprotein n=1 Tax=Rubritalea squalenifaciens DSM 18772 TaxID=1123071 RepID=A0A1M6QI52_9BACT|nr:hypothetical protein [Rubritalea squalenifaciens]SHK19912.1 hypothetical protein SAMN02745181_3407 [Rubritalea squalenifaciens DSM 18772]